MNRKKDMMRYAKRRLAVLLMVVLVISVCGCASQKESNSFGGNVNSFGDNVNRPESNSVDITSSAEVPSESSQTGDTAIGAVSSDTKPQTGESAKNPGFVLLTDMVPDVICDVRYYTSYNFVGKRIDGYEEPCIIITREAAEALRQVSEYVLAKGYRLKVYDAYRPQMAVDHFVRWAADVNDVAMKSLFYPEVDKSRLFSEGYIAGKSGHSRGSTVDLTLVNVSDGKDVDMGGTFDYFGAKSHPDYRGSDITPAQIANRNILREAMLRYGFKPISTEWWHYTLANEPYPNTYFDFPVNSQSVR